MYTASLHHDFAFLFFFIAALLIAIGLLFVGALSLYWESGSPSGVQV